MDKNELAALRYALECSLMASAQEGLDLESLIERAWVGVMGSTNGFENHAPTLYKARVLELLREAAAEVTASREQ